MKCVVVVRTSQNGQFSFKSMFLSQWTEHPHGICLLFNIDHSGSPADWKWPILGVVYYRSWKECVAVVRSITKRIFHHKTVNSTILIDSGLEAVQNEKFVDL